jgi:hypothetical protein
MRALSWIVLAVAATLTGCPKPAPVQTPSAPTRPAKAPKPEPKPEPEPKAEPETESPSESTPPADLATDTSPEPAPPGFVPEPPAKPTQDLDPSLQVLVHGQQVALTPRIHLGLEGIAARDGELIARLALSEGPMSLNIDASSESKIPVGGAHVQVMKIDKASRRVYYRWIGSPSPRASLLRGTAKGTQLDVAEAGFYRLEGGRGFMGVGNVVETKRGNVVTISVFPATYRKDPMQGYDYHYRVKAGQTLKGKVATLQLEAVEQETPGYRSGYVALSLR